MTEFITKQMMLEFLVRMKKDHPNDYDIIKELENEVKNFQ